MLHPKDNIGAFQADVEWAEVLGNREVQGLLASASRNQDVGYSPSIGFVKYGFTHAFRHMKDGTLYLNAIFETLMGYRSV